MQPSCIQQEAPHLKLVLLVVRSGYPEYEYFNCQIDF